MDAKTREFYELQQKDPVSAWTIMAARAKSPKVRKLYEQYAEIETERIASQHAVEDAEAAEMSEAQRLLLLAQDGPTRSESVMLFLSMAWRKLAPVRAWIAEAAVTVGTFADILVQEFSAVWIFAFGVVLYFGGFGLGPGFYVILALGASLATVGVLSRYFVDARTPDVRTWNQIERDKKVYAIVSRALIGLWLVAATYVSYDRTFISDYFRDARGDSSNHYAYLVRNKQIVDMVAFDNKDWDLLPQTMKARRPFQDHLEWLSSVADLVDAQNIKVQMPDHDDRRLTYKASIAYELEPFMLKLPMPAPNDPSDLKEDVRIKMRTALAEALKESGIVKDVGDVFSGEKPSAEKIRIEAAKVSSLYYRIRIMDVAVVPTRLEIKLDGDWHSVGTPKLPEAKH
ncbi:MAG: hypothetical protein JWN50_52 [Parcubacteria group bacterium]|nr:hypothetical protein [Parcubacteria group bacterium]